MWLTRALQNVLKLLLKIELRLVFPKQSRFFFSDRKDENFEIVMEEGKTCVHNCDDHSSLDFKFAVQHYEIFHTSLHSSFCLKLHAEESNGNDPLASFMC